MSLERNRLGGKPRIRGDPGPWIPLPLGADRPIAPPGIGAGVALPPLPIVGATPRRRLAPTRRTATAVSPGAAHGAPIPTMGTAAKPPPCHGPRDDDPAPPVSHRDGRWTPKAG